MKYMVIIIALAVCTSTQTLLPAQADTIETPETRLKSLEQQYLKLLDELRKEQASMKIAGEMVLKCQKELCSK